MTSKTTLVIGASENVSRYSNICIRELISNDLPVEAIGLREGSIEGVIIRKGFPSLNNIHTVTLYIGPQHQPEYYDYILSLKPERVIFNPGTDNPEFETLLMSKGIEVTAACSIMMLHAGLYM